MQENLFPIYNLQRILAFLLLLLCFIGGSGYSFAQKVNTDSATKARQQAIETTRANQKRVADSAKDARQQNLAQTREAQKQAMDSARNSRQHTLDSIRTAQKERTGKMAAARKYRESNHYKDSVTKSRQQHLAAIHNAQKTRADSLQKIRKHATDSLVASRKLFTDALKAKQKKRSDSLLVIRKYKESKRYRDSVYIVKKARTDSLQQYRKATTNALMAARKKSLDSAKAIRKHFTDSATAARKVRTDSIAAVRKIKADKLAKAKADREKALIAKQKQSLLNSNLKLELKIKAKQQVWSNETMLKKHWGVKRRVIQNTFTHYNYYFNANRKMEEALLNMQRLGKDNYDQRIPLFVFDPNRDSTVLAADMDSVIRKASLGIQIHDPRAKWGEDLYLLMGQAFYFKGDYKNAEASFKYIVAMRARKKAEDEKKKAYSNSNYKKTREEPSVVAPKGSKIAELLKHESSNNEALLWLARTYVTSNKLESAESVLDLLGNDPNFPKDLKGSLAVEKANLALAQHNIREAAAELTIAAADHSQKEWLRRRAAYLNGQLLQEMGQYTAAADRFDYVSDLNPKIDLDFYARKNRAYNLMLAGGNQDDAIASLKSMLKDGKYTTYYEQIYYVLGRLAINSNNVQEATFYLQKSVSSAKTTKKQKASSFAMLGNIYYNEGDYELSKKSYDSAAIMSIGIPGDSALLLAIRRSAVLDKVTLPTRTIRTEDSLLLLASMSQKDQRAVIRKYIKSLEKKRADSIFNAENAGLNSVISQESNADNGAPAWYFSNPVQLQQGNTEFKRKWGNRKLVDNWQRGSAQGMIANTNDNSNGAGGADSVAATGKKNVVELDENGIPTEESLLALIPSTEEEKAAAIKMIQRAYVDLGTAYTRQLEDYPKAKKALDTLDKRFPVHPYMAEEAYERYLIALRQNNLTLAQQYSNQILTQYAASTFAEMVKPTEDGGNFNNNVIPVSDYYNTTYTELIDRQYPDVLVRVKTATRQYQDERYAKRFTIVEASAHAGLREYAKADTILTQFMRANATDSLYTWADQVLQYVKGKQKIVDSIRQDSVKTAALKNPPKTAADSAKLNAAPGDLTAKQVVDTAAKAVPKTFAYNPKEAHFFVFSVNAIEARAMGVKAALGDFNNMNFPDAHVFTTLEPMPPAGGGLIVVRSFGDVAKAKAYLNKFKATAQMVREYKEGEYQTFIISASNFQKLTADHDLKAYLNFYKTKY